MGKASDWLREERRKVLGDWVAVCLTCGAGRRWFEQYEAEMPDTCAAVRRRAAAPLQGVQRAVLVDRRRRLRGVRRGAPPGRAVRLEDPPRETLEVFAEERRRDRPRQDLAKRITVTMSSLATSRL